MNIWIDGQCLQTPSRYRGIGRYVQELITALVARGSQLSISFNAGMRDEAVAARDLAATWISPSDIHMWNGVAEGGEVVFGNTARRRLSEAALVHHVQCLRPDVILSASPFEGGLDSAVPYLPSEVNSIPTASIFYDAIPHRLAGEYLPDQARKDYYYRRLNAYKSFDTNLCISSFAQAELVDIVGNHSAHNISAGISVDFLKHLSADTKMVPATPSGDFILYVGALDWRKNVRIIVDAVAFLPASLRDRLSFVMAGDHPANLLQAVRDRWISVGLAPERLVTLGHVSDADLVALYRTCAVLVQPSLMEGFGLTALEAMTCGTAVLGADAGALPEVIGDQELLFPPDNAQVLATRLAHVLMDEPFRKAAIDRGLSRAATMTWARSADLAVAALEEVVGRRPAADAGVSIAARREAALPALDVTGLDPETIAETMARAEPFASPQPRLLIDATSTIRVDHGTGIQRVTKQVSRNLVASPREETAIIYSDSEAGFFFAGLETGTMGTSIDRRITNHVALSTGDTVLMLDSSWEFHRQHLEALLRGRLRGADIVSCLYDTVPLRVQAMCHPGIPLIFADWFKSALTYSTGFVCISRAVADELHALLTGIGFPRPMKIGYWHLGADFSSEAVTAPPRPAETRPSFLMVGTVEPRKGHRVALDAFEELWRANVDVDLVIVGRPGWGVEHLINRLRQHSERGKRLHWHERVSDSELQHHYAGSDALIAASFSEGFGLPLVEARHFGKPVIASDIPVFREVTDGAQSTRFFEVGSVPALVNRVQEFLADRADGRLSAVDDLPWIDWRESAEQIRKVVIEGNWYRNYEPAEHKPFASIFDHGRVEMTAAVPADQRSHRLELLEGPFPSEGGSQRRYILKLTNLSDTPWSSTGDSSGALGVAVSYHVLAADGSMLEYDNPRTRFPFVVPPGDTQYIAVEVPAEWMQKGGAWVEIELVQEAVAWWGDPLRLPL